MSRTSSRASHASISPIAAEALFDQAPVLISVHEGPDHVCRYANALVRKAAGGDVIGQRPIDVLPALARQGTFDILDRVYRSGEPDEVAAYPVRLGAGSGQDGAMRYLRQVATPWLDERGGVIGVTSFSFDVTDEVTARRAAEESEDRIRRILDSVQAFIVRLTPDGVVSDVNAPALEVSGLDRADVLGVALWDTAPWAGNEPARETMKRGVAACAGGATVRWDETLEVGDRTLVADIQLAPKRAASGEIVAVIASATDVTARRDAETALRAERATLDAILDALPVAVVVADAKGRIVRDNPASRELWGLPPETESWEGYADWIGWFPETGERIKADEWAMTKALLGGIETRNELIENQRFGSDERRFYLNNVAPVRNDAGAIVGGVAAMHDVTERRAASEALAASEVRFRAITEAAPQIVWSADADGRADFLNARWREFTGQPEASAYGEGWQSAFHEEDRDAVRSEWAVSVSSGRWFQAEARLRHHEDGYRWCLARALPVKKADGTVERWMGTLTDIDDMKRVEEQRSLLARELDHRVKNTLAIVRSLAVQSFRDRSGDDMAAFEGRLTSLASAHAILVRESWERAELGELASGVLAACGVDADRARIEGPPLTLPPQLATTMALTLHELTTNAIKYGSLSVPRGRVDLAWRVTDEDARRFALSWTESGGPPVETPDHRGFGSRMIEQALAGSLHGECEVRFEPDGLVFEASGVVPPMA